MDIQAIKGKTNILQIAEELGIRIDKNTKRACCPFHDDKTPSLQFSSEKQIATCFSSNCKAGTMDVIELVKKKNNWDLPQTLTFLDNSLQTADAKPIQNNLQSDISEQERTLLLTQLFELFERAFLASKPAKDYAQKRNLNHKLFQIGYNSGTFHHSVNLAQDKRTELLAKYEKLGLLKKFNSGYTVFGKGCLVFPLKNKKGQIVSLYFRSINSGKSNCDHFYLKDRTGLYPSYPNLATQKLILTESIIDAISLKQVLSTDYFVLANYGTKGDKQQIEAISQLEHLKEVIIFFDGDTPGKEGAKKLAEVLQKQAESSTLEFVIKIVQTPENEDVNSLLKKQTETANQLKTLTHLIESAPCFSLSAEKKKEVLVEQVLEGQKTIKAPELLTLSLKGNLLKAEDSLKVTIEALNTQTGRKLRDRVELYEFKQVDRFILTVSEKLGVSLELTENSTHAFIDELETKRELLKQNNQNTHELKNTLTPVEFEQCASFGKRLDLIEALNDLIGQSGIVGEEKNRLFLFGIGCSHRMKKTLHVVVQGSSGSGKTHLIKKIADLMPQESVKRFTRISEKSFYNYGTYDLVNHLIVLEDYDGMKEEAEFALRELQSNEKLISSTSKKDEITGEIKSGENIVHGPIASMVATTHSEMYHDNQTRVFFISIDETKEQTRKIIDYKNKLSAGEINHESQKKAKEFIQKYILSLRALEVKNSWIKHIDLPVHPEQKRRLHSLFEAFCQQITLLFQHQRQKDEQGRIITEKKDIEIAVDLMFESIVLKVDELSGTLRVFYENIKAYVLPKGKDYAFEQREIRQALTMSKTHTFRNLNELLELEYIQKTAVGNRGTFSYKINYWDDLKAMRKRIKENIEEQLNSI